MPRRIVNSSFILHPSSFPTPYTLAVVSIPSFHLGCDDGTIPGGVVEVPELLELVLILFGELGVRNG
jgi:hypothetical protein